MDIVDTAVQSGSFKSLVAAVTAAGLMDTLRGPGPFTVFAPTDEAFAKLPAGTVETLLKPENVEQLKKILAYHVVSGKVTSGDIKPGDVPTVAGKTVHVSTNGHVKINEATVTTADVAADNGVIHVIDTVLIPA